MPCLGGELAGDAVIGGEGGAIIRSGIEIRDGDGLDVPEQSDELAEVDRRGLGGIGVRKGAEILVKVVEELFGELELENVLGFVLGIGGISVEGRAEVVVLAVGGAEAVGWVA